MKTIQQLIKCFNSTEDKQVYNEIVERIKTETLLWISYMPYTNNYYLDFEDGKSSAYVFTEKQYYDEYENDMMQQKISMKPEESKEEQRTFLFGDLYRSGFEILVIDKGQSFLTMSLFDFIEKPDFSNVPEINRPIMNPTLVCTSNSFFQSLSAKDVRHDLEAYMFRELYNAKYLMPLDTSKMNMEKTNTGSGNCVVKEKSIMQFPLITNSEDKSFYPFFTDWFEFRKFDKEQKYSGNIAVFDDIKHFVDKAEGISINPYGVNITLTKDMLNVIEHVVKDSSQDMPIKEWII